MTKLNKTMMLLLLTATPLAAQAQIEPQSLAQQQAQTQSQLSQQNQQTQAANQQMQQNLARDKVRGTANLTPQQRLGAAAPPVIALPKPKKN